MESIERKSFYDIHGRIPVGNEALPADGLLFHTDDRGVSKQCRCDECQFQLRNERKLFEIYKLKVEIMQLKIEIIKDEGKYFKFPNIFGRYGLYLGEHAVKFKEKLRQDITYYRSIEDPSKMDTSMLNFNQFPHFIKDYNEYWDIIKNINPPFIIEFE